MAKTHGIRIEQNGGPEVLQWRELELGEPEAGQVLIHHSAVGLNYADTYHRSGAAKVPLPAVLGLEGAGVVEAVGPSVTSFAVGDRVAYASAPIGSYSERRIYPVERLVKLPSGIDERTAAAVLMRGMTAESLVRRVRPVGAGDTVLFHAAAGGVGSIAVQWLKGLGATVIGTVGSPEKAERVKALGCDHVINYRTEKFVQQVRDFAGGAGVSVVYDGVGKDVFLDSLDCLRPLGTLVHFGAVSGAAPAIEPGQLGPKGSLFLTRPMLSHYIAKREDLLRSADAVFDVVRRGVVKVEINQIYSLKDAARAHADLQDRRTMGSSILVP
jgi:NADPH2:quinone reductase